MGKIERAYDPPKKGKPITNLSAFVTDTLFPAIGGRGQIQMLQDNRNAAVMGALGPASAVTRAPLRPQQGDTSVTFYENPTDHLAAHEIGHVLDNRGIESLLLANVDAKRRPYLGRPNTLNDFFRSNREEYVAEAFARAVESGRHGFSDSTKVDKGMPGTIDLIRWLLTRPPFKKG